MNEAVRHDGAVPLARPLPLEIRDLWGAYVSEEFSANDARAVLVADFTQMLESPQGLQLLQKVQERSGVHVLPVEQAALQALPSPSASAWGAALEERPAQALACLQLAAHYVLLFGKGRNLAPSPPSQVNVRLQHYFESKLELKNLKATFLDKFVSVSGTVLRVSIVKPLVKAVELSCSRCGVTSVQTLTEGRYPPPKTCGHEGCRNRTYILNKETAEKVDFQKIRLQEIVSGPGRQEGRVPRTVECELREDLVECCRPGDLVTVAGVVRHINRDMDIGGGHARSKNNLYDLYIDVNSVVNRSDATRTGRGAPCGISSATYKFSQSDLEGIVEYVGMHEGDLFRHLVHSICPSIYGLEMVKAGIALALFGGVPKHANDRGKVPVRGDVHVLLVGDPGQGKSQLLRAAANCAPRGIFVCGSAVSTAGLTVAVAKDPVAGDYGFEAGAMVLANGGVCCIDEFDKMPAEHQALLEAMEQQSVSVAKAGLVANLVARTSVLAAANPVGGSYNRAKTVNENLKMSAPLLSRFDLAFLLLDSRDELKDHRLSEHVMALYGGGGRANSARQQNILAQAALHSQGGKKNAPLAERLRLDSHKSLNFGPLKETQLRKYIAYARQHCHPRLTAGSCSILQSFYLELRQRSRAADGVPITARQLESLVRLAEARARMELREHVTEQDAQDVVDLMSASLFDRLADERGRVEGARLSGMSRSKETKRFIAHLTQLAAKENRPCFTRKELAEMADDIGLNVPNLEDVIDKMNEAGFLLQKGGGKYEVQL